MGKRFGNAVREGRELKGLGLRAGAREAGVSANGLSRIEEGLTDNPTPATMAALLRAFGLGGERRLAILRLLDAIDEAAARMNVPTRTLVACLHEQADLWRL